MAHACRFIYRHISKASVSAELRSKSRLFVRNIEQCGLGSFQQRNFAENPQQRKGGGGFLGNLMDNIREEMQKNKDLEANLKKLKAETERLEQSEALQKAREKYQLVERETFRSSQVLKEKLEELRQQLIKTMEEAKSTELGQKAVKYSEDVAKTAREAAETLSKSAEALSANPTYKSVAEGMKTVKKEIDDITLSDARLYKRPDILKKREEHAVDFTTRVVEPNEEATGMVLTKESKFYARWKSFVDNNSYVNKLLEFKMRYEESDTRLARVSKFFTDKISDAVSAVLSHNNVSEVLTEIKKVDPNFDSQAFLRQIELEIIPNVLEASLSGNVEVLKDWCYERAYAQLSHLGTDCKRAGYILRYTILDVDNVQVEGGEMGESGPVLAVVFRSQQVRYLETPQGKVVEGSPDQILLINHVWAICRDMDEMNPRAAWKILEAAESAKPMLL